MDSDEAWTVKIAVQQLFPANKKLSGTLQKSKINLRRQIRYAIKTGKLPLIDNDRFRRSDCLQWADRKGLNIPAELRPFFPNVFRAWLQVAPVIVATIHLDSSVGGFVTPQSLEQAIALLHEFDNQIMQLQSELRQQRRKVTELQAKNEALQAENETLKSKLQPLDEGRSKGGRNAAKQRYASLQEQENQLRKDGYPKRQAHKKAFIEQQTRPRKKV